MQLQKAFGCIPKYKPHNKAKSFFAPPPLLHGWCDHWKDRSLPANWDYYVSVLFSNPHREQYIEYEEIKTAP